MGNALPTNGHEDPVEIVTDYLRQQAARLDAQAQALKKAKQKKSGKEKGTPWDQDRTKIRDAIVAALNQGQITSDSIYSIVRRKAVEPMMLDLALEAEQIHARSKRAALVLEMNADKDRQILLQQLRASDLGSEAFDNAILESRLNIGDNMQKSWLLSLLYAMRNKQRLIIAK